MTREPIRIKIYCNPPESIVGKWAKVFCRRAAVGIRDKIYRRAASVIDQALNICEYKSIRKSREGTSSAESVPCGSFGSFSMGAFPRKALTKCVKPDVRAADHSAQNECRVWRCPEIGWYRDSHRPLSNDRRRCFFMRRPAKRPERSIRNERENQRHSI